MSATPALPIPDTEPRPVLPVEGLAPGTIASWLDWATRALDGASASARADAEVLMAAQLRLPRSQLRPRFEESILAALALQFVAAVERRRMGEPVAYITGSQGFWSLELNVNPAVLIPRPDTEILVEWALQLIPGTADFPVKAGAAARILDLGTGSGAIALALAREIGARTQVVATDCSENAVKVAKENAHVLNLNNVEFRVGDWFSALRDEADEVFDLIVSNPPYIAEGDAHLSELSYEPRLALTSGADGLNAIRLIVSEAQSHLKPGAFLLLEHGHDQGAAVRALLARAGFTDVETRRDFGDNERVSGGRRR